jgi:hypothetical protein
MDMQPPRVVTTAGDAEIDHAVATLVLAFGTDPVARWMYDDPHQYLLHIPRLFRALGKSSFEGGARSAPTTASGSRSGFHRVFTAIIVSLRRLLQEA